MEQPRPLEALHDVEIDDVDVILAVQSLEYGLVGRVLGKFDERANRIVGLESVEELLGVGFGEAF